MLSSSIVANLQLLFSFTSVRSVNVFSIVGRALLYHFIQHIWMIPCLWNKNVKKNVKRFGETIALQTPKALLQRKSTRLRERNG